ncbi:MAG: serine/threonine protein kinase [Cyanobacteria bacterium J083]|nr:MAG: serine/threonine protein kinase [Cyanobacteria bacterium J083]
MIENAWLNNRYKILKTLGRGGFGETFLAIDTHMPSERKCVIKQLKPMLQEEKIPVWIQDRFKQEAAILERLGEKNSQIPRLYAYFAEKNHFYLVQEWIDGLTLTEAVQKEGKFSVRAVEQILIDLLPVLDYIHTAKIIHRDIKPDNIILPHDNKKPVLIDFGAVKEALVSLVHPHNQPSGYSIAIGTPGYMPPEQAAGRPLYSSDLYSLGLTAVFLLTAKHPQELPSNPQTGEILWRKELPDLPGNLATVLDRVLRFNPAERFANANSMLRVLTTTDLARNKTTIPKYQATTPLKTKPTQVLKTPTVYSNQKGVANSISWFFSFLIALGLGLAGLAGGIFLSINSFKQSQNNDPQPEVTTEIPEEKQPIEVEPEAKPETETKLPAEESTPEIIVEQPNETETEIEPAESENNSVTVPIILTGTDSQKIEQTLGEPTSKRPGYWQNSQAWLYKGVLSEQVDLGYLIDKKTNKVRQTEASFHPSTDLASIQNTLAGLLQDKDSTAIGAAVAEVYYRQTDLRSFNLSNLKVLIQRNPKDKIYIAVWEADFHR